MGLGSFPETGLDTSHLFLRLREDKIMSAARLSQLTSGSENGQLQSTSKLPLTSECKKLLVIVINLVLKNGWLL